MFWWIWRLLWWPRWTYSIVVASSHASAEEARNSALINYQRAGGGEIIGIAAADMCCQNEAVPGGCEWDVYLLVRK